MKATHYFPALYGTLVMLALASCDPQAFSLNVEMKQASTSGIDIDGKTVSIVYLDSGNQVDSMFNESLAGGFASALEKEYFGGEETVDMFYIDKNPAGNYSSVDTLINLVVDTGSDVVFLFDAPEFGTMNITDAQLTNAESDYYSVNAPVTVRLYGFDSLSGRDTVRTWTGTRRIAKNISTNDAMTRDEAAAKFWNEIQVSGMTMGEASARTFTPSWKEESFTFIYYESASKWLAAAQYAYDYQWKEAIDVWLQLVDTKNLMKRSCAEYNIAAACYLSGENELALKWLDRSDKDYPISLSADLRKKIVARIK